MGPRDLLLQLFDAAVAAALPSKCMAGVLPQRPPGAVTVVGAGKAAAHMARELERQWQGDLHGLVVVPYGHSAACRNIEVIEAAHPVPDAACVAASRRLLDTVSNLEEGHTVVCLLSGGGSSLLTLPPPWLTLAQKQHINKQLLQSGAAIDEINCVRKQLSDIKGGKLAAAIYPANVLTYLISDVPGDDISVIASGPTVASTTSAQDALDVIDRYHVELPAEIRSRIQTAKAVDPARIRGEARILANTRNALQAAAALAAHNGIEAIVLGEQVGDARELAKQHATLAKDMVAGGGRAVLISGGETTVHVTGSGRGGRNGEYALALAIELGGAAGVSAIACDTDGIDGVGDNAGSLVTADTLARARAISLDAVKLQRDNDSYRFFETLGDLVHTGPTGTNVNDFRAVLVGVDDEFDGRV